MPTFNRRAYVPSAVRYFLSQDYDRKELLVFDDGDESVADLMPGDSRVRYFRLDRRTVLGEKRNLACEEARGEIIAHWDDDDWMAPWRLRHQIGELLDQNADACGVDHLFFYQPEKDLAWCYFYEKGGRRWIAGGTLCYKKAFWRSNPFPAVSIGEDTRFVWADHGGRVLAHSDYSFYVAMIHRGNTSPKVTSSLRYHPHSASEVRRMIGEDLEACAGVGFDERQRRARERAMRMEALQ